MAHLAFECDLKLLFKGVVGKLHLESPVAADGDALGAFGLLAEGKDRLAGVCLFRVMPAADLHPHKTFLRDRVGVYCLDVRLKTPVAALLRLDLSREIFQKLVLQPEVLALVIGAEDFQPRHVHIQIHLFPDERVSGAQRLDLRVGERLLVHIVAGAHRGFAGHDLGDKFLLVFQRLIEVGVEDPLRHILVDLHLLVLVALPDDAPVALGHVGGAPAHIQMVDRHKPVLHVGPGPHFLRGAEQDAHLARPYFPEQFFLFGVGVRGMDKCDLIRGDSGSHQLVPDVIVDIESPVALGGGQVAEQ